MLQFTSLAFTQTFTFLTKRLCETNTGRTRKNKILPRPSCKTPIAGVCAAVVAGEGEGAAEDLPQSVADGELDTPQDEPQLISHDE